MSGRHLRQAPEPSGVYARIPLDELTLTEAEGQVDDASWWSETRIPILFHFHIAPADYWDLTVGDHREMVAYLEQRGIGSW